MFIVSRALTLYNPLMERVPFFSLSSRAIIALALTATIFTLSIILPPKLRHTQPYVAAVITTSTPFIYSFNSSGTLHEASSPGESTSPYWWLNSGGKMMLDGSVGKTIQGNLPALDKWRVLYAVSNPTDTDNGYHPQNIFRLLTKNVAGNQRVESLFKIEKDNWSGSPNRNASNGLLLMSRYLDGDNLYYAGIRVDGDAVIKKKYKGKYYTMAQKEIFTGAYNRDSNINLIPHKEWVGLRTENVANADGTVTVRLFMKRANETSWTKLLEAKDDGVKYGAVIKGNGTGGIRTDFMDVSFESFRLEAL